MRLGNVGRLAALSAASLVLLALVTAAGSPRAMPVSRALMNPFPTVVGCSVCGNCVGGHTANSGNDQNAIHSSCVPIVGCNGHGACPGGGGGDPEDPGGDLEELSLLIDQAVGGNAIALEEAVSEFPRRVYLNPDRHALQVEGCQPGSVAGHVWLSPDEYKRLSSLRDLAL